MGSPEIPGEPQTINKNGEVAHLIDGWSVDDPENPEVVRFGILKVDIMKLHGRGQNSALGQFYSIVTPGLIMVRHIFRGLNRPLCTDDCMEADTKKLIHTWRPRYDFYWDNGPRRLPAVANCVFVVLISKNERHHLEKWPEVYGWIDRWNWVYEDAYLSEAPLNWFSRYGEKLFTREGA